jgi:hypothetical protein
MIPVAKEPCQKKNTDGARSANADGGGRQSAVVEYAARDLLIQTPEGLWYASFPFYERITEQPG